MRTHDVYYYNTQSDSDLIDILRDVVSEFTEPPYKYESDQAMKARLWSARTEVTKRLVKILKESTP